jgi:hypothetical protein
VAGLGDDHLGHLGGGVPHDDRLGGTEGLRAPDREDRHGQLGAHRRLVVLDIGRERQELGEGRAHGTRPGIELRVMDPRGLVNLQMAASIHLIKALGGGWNP